MNRLLLILFIVIVICFIFIIIKFRRDILIELKKKEIRTKILIDTFILGVILFFITWLINSVVLDPLFSPRIELNTYCTYGSPLGQYKLEIRNDGEAGEEGFVLIMKNTILANFSTYALSNEGMSVILFEHEYNLSAYKFMNDWSKEYCTLEHTTPILEEDPRPIPESKRDLYEDQTVKIFCEYFPPKSTLSIAINTWGTSRDLEYEFFGKNTPIKYGIKKCKAPVCYNPFKDFILDVYFKVMNKKQFIGCGRPDNRYSKYFGR